MNRAAVARWVNAGLLVLAGAVAGFVIGASTVPAPPAVLLPPPAHTRSLTPCVMACATPPPATPVVD